MSSRPLHVLILGAGVSALEATLALRALAEERVDIELLAPDEDFVYRPMAVAEPFQHGEARRFPLARLVELAGARLTPGTLAGVDLDGRSVETADGTELRWDALLVALGAAAHEGVPGALTFRGPDDRAALTETVDDAVAGRFGSVTFALPALAAWPLPLYELALMTKIRLEDAGATGVRVDLVTPEAEPLAVFGAQASASVKSLLETRGIGLHANTTPVVFRNGALVVVPGRAIRTERVVALPVPEGRRIPGLPVDARGFVRADLHGRWRGETTSTPPETSRRFRSSRAGSGLRRGGGDRRARRRRGHAAALPARPSRAAADRAHPEVHVCGPAGQLLRGRHRTAVVAAGQDRRPAPRAVPGHEPGVVDGAAAGGAGHERARRRARAITGRLG